MMFLTVVIVSYNHSLKHPDNIIVQNSLWISALLATIIYVIVIISEVTRYICPSTDPIEGQSIRQASNDI